MFLIILLRIGRSLLIILCCFEYNGPEGYMAFSPKVTPENFKVPFTAAQGWGTFSQVVERRKQTESVKVVYGKLELKVLF